MRRIVIVEYQGAWTFPRDGAEPVVARSPLLAGVEAMKYGESLQGRTLGYIVRMFLPGTQRPEDMVTLHTRVF